MLKLVVLVKILFLMPLILLIFFTSESKASTVNFIHTNHQGSVVEVTDEQGSVSERERYFAYGEERYSDGDTSERKYTGQIKDNASNLYYYNARYYDGKLSIFISPDTTDDQLNRYSYVSANPIMFIDPMGTHHTGGSRLSGGVGRRGGRGRGGPASEWRRPETDNEPCVLCQGAPELARSSDYTPDSDEYSRGRFSFGFLQLVEYVELASDYITNDEVTPIHLLEEWFTGDGPRDRIFVGGDLFTDIVREHDWIDNVRGEITTQVASGDYQSEGRYPYSLGGVDGVWSYMGDWIPTFWNDRNIAVAYLGSYNLEYSISGFDVTDNTVNATFHVSNSSSPASAFHPPIIGYTDFWQTNIDPVLNLIYSEGPLSSTYQEFWWTETLSLDENAGTSHLYGR